MKYRILVNRKKSFNLIKDFKFNAFKNVHLFTRIFRYSWCRMPQIIPSLSNFNLFCFLVFMYAEYFAIYFILQRLAITEAEDI